MAIRSGGIVGLDKLIQDFQSFGDKAMPYLKTATDNASVVVLAAARANLSKNKSINTRTLYNSLKKGPAKLSRKSPYVVTGVVMLGKETDWKSKSGKQGNYAVQVEFGHQIGNRTGGYYKVGTHKKANGKYAFLAAAKPFMRPAADESKQAVIDIMTSAMNKAIMELSEK